MLQTGKWSAGEFLQRRPALAAAVLFTLGIFTHRAAPASPSIALIIFAGLIMLSFVVRARATTASIILALAIFLGGVIAGQLEKFYFANDQIGLFATDTPRLAQLELLIDHEPRILSEIFNDRPLPPKQVVDARVLRVLTKTGWQDCTGELLVQITQPHPQLAIGQRVRVLGMLERPAPAANPGQFDWAAYYREQRVLASIHIPNASNIRILSPAHRGPFDWLRYQARRLLALGFPADRSLDHALLRAMLVGDHDPEMRDVQDEFRKTGTSHHLALSGMHVAILTGFVLLIGRFSRLRPRWNVAIMLAFAGLYGIVALPAPPIARAILLCFFFGIALLSGRAVNAMQLLFVCAWAMLIVHPLDLYNAGFQLGFGIIFGMMILTPPFARWLESLRRDPLDVSFPTPLAKKTVFEHLRLSLRWMESALWSMFAAGIVAWIVAVPLVAFHFGQLNPWAVACSIILAPIVLVALIGGLLKIVLSLILPGFSHAWAIAAAQPVVWMRGTLGLLARLPGSDFPVPAWPVWGLVAIYCVYLPFIVPCPIPKLRILVRLAPLAVLAAAFVLPFRSVERAVVAPQDLRLTLLSVGAGQAAVLEAPSGKTIVFDAGSTSLSDPLRKCIAPFLRSRSCTHIDTMLLTHTDYDHINGAAGVATVYDVAQVLVGSRFVATAQDSATALALLQTLDSLDHPPSVVVPGQHIALAKGVDAEVLWPPVGASASDLSSNESALVTRLTFAGKSILFTGDIQDIAERALLKHPEKLKADILIAPHHGSSEDTTADFVRAVDPKFILSSNDRTPTGKQKNFDRLTRDRAVFRTDRCGAITVLIAADGTVRVEPFVQHEGH